MKKIFAVYASLFLFTTVSAQYMIIGTDSISLADFKKEYEYGLKNNGIENTIKTMQDFRLLQQFAQEKKADTTAAFQQAVWQREDELRKDFFYPKNIKEQLLQDFVTSSRTEKKVQIFMVQKQAGDTHDYQKIYNDVKSGEMTMEEAINTYAGGNVQSIYLKPGAADNTLYNEIKSLPDNSYTKLVNNSGYAAFAKVLGSRPSLGYMIFGTLSYPDDAKDEETKTKIYAELKSGKTFQEVAKIYGSTDNEKNNGGVVMGSPTLPDEIYNALKGQTKGFYSQPVLSNGKYYIFNIYQLYPYQLTDENREFYFQELQNSNYAELLQEKMLDYIKSQPGYREFPVLQNLKKSYTAFNSYTKVNDPVIQYKDQKVTVADLKKVIDQHKEDAPKLTDAMWSDALTGLVNQNIMNAYNQEFKNIPEVHKQLEETRKMMYSDYIFSKYLKEEVDKNPQWLTAYYNKNKSNYMWENRAKGRVAIIADPALVSEISKQIKDPKNWESLKAKYYGKLNAQKQILVHFEEGNMSENADVFTKYKVPFSKGVHATKMEKRDLVIAIDDLLKPTQMTEAEAHEMLVDAVTDQKLNELTAAQRAKTNITVQPGFVEELAKNFKK